MLKLILSAKYAKLVKLLKPIGFFVHFVGGLDKAIHNRELSWKSKCKSAYIYEYVYLLRQQLHSAAAAAAAVARVHARGWHEMLIIFRLKKRNEDAAWAPSCRLWASWASCMQFVYLLPTAWAGAIRTYTYIRCVDTRRHPSYDGRTTVAFRTLMSCERELPFMLQQQQNLIFFNLST